MPPITFPVDDVTEDSEDNEPLNQQQTQNDHHQENERDEESDQSEPQAYEVHNSDHFEKLLNAAVDHGSEEEVDIRTSVLSQNVIQFPQNGLNKKEEKDVSDPQVDLS